MNWWINSLAEWIHLELLEYPNSYIFSLILLILLFWDPLSFVTSLRFPHLFRPHFLSFSLSFISMHPNYISLRANNMRKTTLFYTWPDCVPVSAKWENRQHSKFTLKQCFQKINIFSSIIRGEQNNLRTNTSTCSQLYFQFFYTHK